ncbi:ABC transporter ATP-binding protein [Ekhidna sp.]|uniref:ABC transporter ATP-binding protein n=1 Tax=Ekhidna sp. TaxID=2608089 RepID=UPI003B511535
MILKGENIGKKFGRNWIFRDLNFQLNVGERIAIVGKNGAGKSTLLQIMAGFLTPSKGTVLVDEQSIDDSDIQISFIGPYTEIIEEFTLNEFLTFHNGFKKNIVSIEEMADSASLPLDKAISEFSTGMKQRTKLLTCFYFKNDIIFMDEPTSNLDEEGVRWWENGLSSLKNQLIIIASNDLHEISMCDKKINL